MANIRVDLNHKPIDGEAVAFKAPCDASNITGLILYYENDAKETVSQEFTLADANGGDIGVMDHIFAEGSIVKVILDTDESKAFVQNANTNTYLEQALAEKAPGGYGWGEANGKVVTDAFGGGVTGIVRYFQNAANNPFTVGGATFGVYHDKNYGFLVPYSTRNQTLAIVFQDGGNFTSPRFINPEMSEGTPYRTVERINGKDVFKKVVNGVFYYSIDDGATWNEYAVAVGAVPASQTIQMVKLWENASVGTFEPQKISLDLGEYPMIAIQSHFYNASRCGQIQFFLKRPVEQRIQMYADKIGERGFTSDDSGITFNEGKDFNTYGVDTVTTNNLRIVPVRIWGVKGVQ